MENCGFSLMKCHTLMRLILTVSCTATIDCFAIVILERIF
jgi:hypothetical protein